MKKYIKNDKILKIFKVKYRVKTNKIWQNFKHFNSKIKGKNNIINNEKQQKCWCNADAYVKNNTKLLQKYEFYVIIMWQF